jgi:hypothetical protein
MIVTVQRSGGFAGLTRTWQVDVDAEPDTESWLVLLELVPWAEAPAPTQPVQPDRFVWVISAGTTPAKKAKLPEQQLTGPWRELVDRVRETSDAERAAEAGRDPAAGDGAGIGDGAGRAGEHDGARGGHRPTTTHRS